MYIGLREKIMLIALAGVALAAYVVFSWMGLEARSASYRPEIVAARRTLQAELVIGEIKGSDNVAAQVAGDSVQAAMIGLPTSAITTDPGSLRSKVTSTNPNFAAAVVAMLRKAGVGPGDVVAVSYTGSTRSNPSPAGIRRQRPSGGHPRAKPTACVSASRPTDTVAIP